MTTVVGLLASTRDDNPGLVLAGYDNAALQQLAQLVYRDSEQPILSLNDRDVLLEVINMMTVTSLADLVGWLSTIATPADLIFEQPALADVRNNYQRRVQTATARAVSVKGVSKCGRCKSDRISKVKNIQRRSGDEAVDSDVTCAVCGLVRNRL